MIRNGFDLHTRVDLRTKCNLRWENGDREPSSSTWPQCSKLTKTYSHEDDHYVSFLPFHCVIEIKSRCEKCVLFKANTKSSWPRPSDVAVTSSFIVFTLDLRSKAGGNCPRLPHADSYTGSTPLCTLFVQDQLYQLALRDILLRFSISRVFVPSN